MAYLVLNEAVARRTNILYEVRWKGKRTELSLVLVCFECVCAGGRNHDGEEQTHGGGEATREAGKENNPLF